VRGRACDSRFPLLSAAFLTRGSSVRKGERFARLSFRPGLFSLISIAVLGGCQEHTLWFVTEHGYQYNSLPEAALPRETETRADAEIESSVR